MPQDKTNKKSAITPLSLKVGDLLRGAYNAARMNQATLAERSGIAPGTLQKKLAGKAPITTTDLVLIAGAIPDTDAGKILEEAVALLGGYEQLLSAASSTNNDVEKKRKQAEAESMTTEKIEDTAKRATNRSKKKPSSTTVT